MKKIPRAVFESPFLPESLYSCASSRNLVSEDKFVEIILSTISKTPDAFVWGMSSISRNIEKFSLVILTPNLMLPKPFYEPLCLRAFLYKVPVAVVSMSDENYAVLLSPLHLKRCAAIAIPNDSPYVSLFSQFYETLSSTTLSSLEKRHKRCID